MFVLFLDIDHVDVDGSRNIRKPLVDTLDRLIGPDDLIAVMTPDMSARDITFARKTTTIEGILDALLDGASASRSIQSIPRESSISAAIPGITVTCADGATADDRGVADEMIERRREKQTLDALGDLVAYLRGVREERKAIIADHRRLAAVRPHERRSRARYCQAPRRSRRSASIRGRAG